MWIGIISIFPEMFKAISDYGVISRAIKRNLLILSNWNPRDFTCNRYRNIDDRPYGGGQGMVMTVKPLKSAIAAAKSTLGINTKVIYLSPQGRTLNQKSIHQLAENQKLILVCGRYQGIDERLIQSEINEEWSIGDYILTGGELPAMVLIDSISRFISGLYKYKISEIEDSFSDGLLSYPYYTRPAVVDGIEVPRVLLSGNHEKIRLWRLKQSLGRTWLKRPDLIKKLSLTQEKEKLLKEFKLKYIKNKI